MISEILICSRFIKVSDTYDEAAFIHQKIAENLANVVRDRLRNWKIEPPKNIIDIGSGTGILTENLCTVFEGTTITLVDISKTMLEVAQKKIQKKYSNNAVNHRNFFRYVNANAEYIDFSKIGKCDFLASSMTMQWFTDIETFLKRAIEYCGCVAISAPISGTFKEWYELLKEFGIDCQSLKYKSWEEFIDICGRLNCSNIEVTKESYNIDFQSPRDCARYIKAIGANISNSIYDINKLKRLFLASTAITLNYDVMFAVMSKKSN